MESALGKKVYLELRVEVRKDWRRNPKELRRLGYSDEVA
jgi:GTP-binding protein Era